MSFLIDGPWLYANGRAIAELPKEAQQPVAAATIFRARAKRVRRRRPPRTSPLCSPAIR